VSPAKCWAWYGYNEPDESDPHDDGDIECAKCETPLDDGHIVNGHGCGDCGKALCELGSDYCAACAAAHDTTEQADPLHHHVWQTTDEWQAMVREITLAQAGAR
jgi:hypothetical protein